MKCVFHLILADFSFRLIQRLYCFDSCNQCFTCDFLLIEASIQLNNQPQQSEIGKVFISTSLEMELLLFNILFVENIIYSNQQESK